MSKTCHFVSGLSLVSLIAVIVLLAVDPNSTLDKLFPIDVNNISSSSSSTKLPPSTSSTTELPKLCSKPNDSAFPPLQPPPEDALTVIKDYISFHRHGRHCLISGECEAPPLLLYDSLRRHKTGGLGYRIATIQWAFLFAIATHRLFFLPWPESDTGSNSFDITTAFHPASIDWRPPIEVLKETYRRNDTAGSDGVHGRRFACFATVKHHHESFYFKSIEGRKASKATRSIMYKLSESNFTKVFEPYYAIYVYAHDSRSRVTRLFSNPFYKHGVFKAFSNSETFIMSLERSLTRVLFRPSQAVSDLVDQRVFLSPSEPFVSVHMRTGEDLNETNQDRMHHVMDSLSLYSDRMLDCAMEVHPAGKERIFLASDSMTFKQIFIERASLRGIMVKTQKERSSMHFKKLAAVHESELELRCMQFLDVFADIFALGKADALVARLSSFAMAGIALGEAKRAVQLYLPLKQEKGECDVESIVSGKVKGSSYNGLWYEGPLGKMGKLYRNGGFKSENWSLK